MQYRFLGKTGLKISELAMGTQTFGWGADENTAHYMADLFRDAGGNFFDTANIYNNGTAESMLGTWIKKQNNRDSLIIASKVFFPTGNEPNDTGLSRKHILNSIDQSLQRLQTDYLDLYQMHCQDNSTPIEETLAALDDVVKSGKVRYVGASNYNPSTLQKALMLGKINGWAGFSSLQAEYSLIVRSTEWELLALCMEEGLGFLAWSPLAGGWLTGKYQRNRPAPPDSRVGRKDRWDDQPEQRESELTRKVVDTIMEISSSRGKSPSQIALRWLLQKPGVTAPIIGARTPEQLEQNLGCLNFDLTEEEMGQLNSASSIPLPYPYRFIQRYTRKRCTN
ncbi:MAG: aldo/keto reductase [Spirochaetota bacterium]